MSSCVRETIKGGVAIVGTDESRTSLGEVSREKVDCDSKRAQLSPTRSDAERGDDLPQPRPVEAGAAAAASAAAGDLRPVAGHRAGEAGQGRHRADRPARANRSRPTSRAKMLVKGKFYDLAAAGKSLAAGGTYAATAGSQRDANSRSIRPRDRAQARSSAGWCACRSRIESLTSSMFGTNSHLIGHSKLCSSVVYGSKFA